MVMPHILHVLHVHLNSFVPSSVLKDSLKLTHSETPDGSRVTKRSCYIYTLLCSGNWEGKCVCTLFLGHWTVVINSNGSEFSDTSYNHMPTF